MFTIVVKDSCIIMIHDLRCSVKSVTRTNFVFLSSRFGFLMLIDNYKMDCVLKTHLACQLIDLILIQHCSFSCYL
jgi:hypothetical protein